MNHGQYPEAIELLTQEHLARPQDTRVTVLLAQANLGVAKLEMLDLADHVMSGRLRSGHVDLRDAASCPAGPIHNIQDSEPRCVLFRILGELPEPDEPHVLFARDLLRSTFPDPVRTPTDINFLSAFVEFSSALSRSRVFVTAGQFALPVEGKLSLFIHQAKGVLGEFQQGIKRARYSYGKVSRFVANLDGKPLIEIGGQKLVFNEDIGVPSLLRFLGSALHESAGEIDGALNSGFDGSLGNLGSGFVEVLRSLDIGSFGGQSGYAVESSFRFEVAINQALNSIADGMERDPQFDVFSMAWENPPRIFRNLSKAAAQTWDSEDPAPLKAYLAETKADWDELEFLRFGWENWINERLNSIQRDQLLSYLRLMRSVDPRLSGPPDHLSAESLRRWQTDFVDALKSAILGIFDGTALGVPVLDSGQIQDGRELLAESLQWVSRNLWVGGT